MSSLLAVMAWLGLSFFRLLIPFLHIGAIEGPSMDALRLLSAITALGILVLSAGMSTIKLIAKIK